MISSPLTLMVLAAGLPALGIARPNTQNIPTGEVSKRDYLAFFWEAYTPSPSTNYEARYKDDSAWFTLDPDDAGEELSTSGDKIGYRLQNDASSAIIYHLSPNNSLITASYTTTTNSSENNDSNPSIEIQGTLTAFYTSTIPTNSTGPVSSSNSDDIWNSQHPTPIILNKTILAQNVDCEPGMTITITTLDANGQAVVYSAVDMVVAPVPGALPARVTVGNDVGAVEMVLWFNGLEPVSVSLGMGNVPVPQASLVAVVQFCPD